MQKDDPMVLQFASLAEKAREGNRYCFQGLVTMFQEDIYRFAYYRTFSQPDAEDLAQEVFEQAYRKIATLHDPFRFRAWLYRIALNRCNDFLRKKKYLALLQIGAAREQESRDAGMAKDSSNITVDRKRFWQKVRSMLERLSPMERQVFTLRFMDHRSISEIAAILDKKESTVKTHLYRALDKVRRDSEVFREYREHIA
jgi:RNA polymerase sigma-70 factor (ECF subfamily)